MIYPKIKIFKWIIQILNFRPFSIKWFIYYDTWKKKNIFLFSFRKMAGGGPLIEMCYVLASTHNAYHIRIIMAPSTITVTPYIYILIILMKKIKVLRARLNDSLIYIHYDFFKICIYNKKVSYIHIISI